MWLISSQVNFQRVLCRPTRDMPVQKYVPAQFPLVKLLRRSVMTLLQLAKNEGQKFSVTEKRLRTDFYVDNLLSGTETKREARDLLQQMVELLKAGGFIPRKWAASDPELLNGISVTY